MHLWKDKFSRTMYMIWMKRNNFTVRESNGIKSKFLLNFLGKLLVIMQNIIPILDNWHILLKYSIKKKSFNKPNLICLGVVEPAKSMEGTKRAQWVLPGNCLWGRNCKHAEWLCYVNWYINHMEYQMSTWDIKRRHGWEKDRDEKRCHWQLSMYQAFKKQRYCVICALWCYYVSWVGPKVIK